MSCSYYMWKGDSWSGDYFCCKKNDYVNSDVYSRYCRDYNYDNCPIYKAQTSSDSSGCYLTSACVRTKGLPDDCHELQTLRSFRDGWLKAQPEGEAEIRRYYETAPNIVAAIDARADAGAVYDRLYSELVAPCVAMIEGGDMEGTYRRYREMTLELEKVYL